MNKVLSELIQDEIKRQNKGLELIASENYVSQAILEAQGSILTNKYAEGYPDKRYYGGCEVIDRIENLAIYLACKLFDCKYANVQPHSGSQANFAAYRALMPDGGKVLSLDLNDGGHLTHGSPVSFSSHLYNFVHYRLDSTGHIDYEQLKNIIIVEQPDVVLAGFSAYPYEIDFKTIREIIDKINETRDKKPILFMVDMAHIAGLVAAKKHMSPIPYADVVTSTTHKTLRGPRGGLILTNDELLDKKINSAVFPYTQGGPLEHVIAAKAQCFYEALSPSFVDYINNVITNTREACKTFQKLGAITSGTDNHLFLLNTYDSFGLTGKEAQELLELAGITTNKNMIPGDTLKPTETSGLRIGFAALTTRGCTVDQAKVIAETIYKILSCQISVIEGKIIVKEIAKQLKDITKL